MDENEFRRALDLFPVVRPRDYQIDLDSSRQSTSGPAQNDLQQRELQDAPNEGDKKKDNRETDCHDTFWDKLKLAVGKKVGEAEAEKFCEAFQRIHKKLVSEGLSLDAARKYINYLSKNSEK